MGIKFPTSWKTLIIKFPPPQDSKGVKCPGYAWWGGCWSFNLTDTLRPFYLLENVVIFSTKPTGHFDIRAHIEYWRLECWHLWATYNNITGKWPCALSYIQDSSSLARWNSYSVHHYVSNSLLTLTVFGCESCFKLASNSENKPPGLYFSKALFEGLIFGGANKRREVCVSKSAILILGGKFVSQNRLG